MYHFPKWKYWLVIILMLVGLLFSLPNLYGEGPALQLSRNDRQAIDEAGIERVRGVLQAQNIPIEASYLQKDRAVLRFTTQEQQTQAREAIAKGTNGEFVIAIANVPRTPDWLRKMGLK